MPLNATLDQYPYALVSSDTNPLTPGLRSDLFHSKKSPEGGVGSSIRAVSGENEAGELRVGRDWVSHRAQVTGRAPVTGRRVISRTAHSRDPIELLSAHQDRSCAAPSTFVSGRIPGAHVGASDAGAHVASRHGPAAVHDVRCDRPMVPRVTNGSHSAPALAAARYRWRHKPIGS